MSENNLQFKLNKINELTLYKNINKIPTDFVLRSSQTSIKLFISYTNIRFEQFTTFTIYDSKCRACKDLETGLLDVIYLIFYNINIIIFFVF